MLARLAFHHDTQVRDLVRIHNDRLADALQQAEADSHAKLTQQHSRLTVQHQSDVQALQAQHEVHLMRVTAESQTALKNAEARQQASLSSHLAQQSSQHAACMSDLQHRHHLELAELTLQKEEELRHLQDSMQSVNAQAADLRKQVLHWQSQVEQREGLLHTEVHSSLAPMFVC